MTICNEAKMLFMSGAPLLRVFIVLNRDNENWDKQILLKNKLKLLTLRKDSMVKEIEIGQICIVSGLFDKNTIYLTTLEGCLYKNISLSRFLDTFEELE